MCNKQIEEAKKDAVLVMVTRECLLGKNFDIMFAHALHSFKGKID
jgi:hypothetical protein